MPFKDENRLKEYRKYWYSKNKEEVKFRATARYSTSSNSKKLLAAARQRAKQKGLEFSITVDDIIIPEFCPILNKPLERFTPYAPSVDRLDSTKGYTKNNVWVISRRANLMKNDGTEEDLKEFSKWVQKHFQL